MTLASDLASLVTVWPSTSSSGHELHGVTGLALDLVDHQDVADGDLLLAAAGADDRVHVKLTL